MRKGTKVFVMRQVTVFHGAHRHTHICMHGLPNQALKTARLSVTIWKKFRRNRRARFGCAVEVGFLRVNAWLFPKGWDSFGGCCGHVWRRGCRLECGCLGSCVFAAGDWADCGLVVEAYPFRWGLGFQCSVYSRGRCCTVHDRCPGIPAGFGPEVHPG